MNNNLTMQPKSHTVLYILLFLLIVIIVGALIGWVTYTKFKGNMTVSEAFFDSQNAYVAGEITAVSEGTVTIKNKKEMIKEFKTSPATTVIAADNKGIASPSADLKKIAVGKTYSVSLAMGVDGIMEVTTIIENLDPARAVNPEQVPPPPATNSARVAPTVVPTVTSKPEQSPEP